MSGTCRMAPNSELFLSGKRRSHVNMLWDKSCELHFSCYSFVCHSVSSLDRLQTVHQSFSWQNFLMNLFCEGPVYMIALTWDWVKRGDFEVLK